MVEIRALIQFLERLGIPVAVTSFFGDLPLPAIVLLPTGLESSGSDFAAELRRASYQIELYTVQKDMALEEQLETLLDGQGIRFEKYETYLDEEAMYQCAYQIQFYYVK